MVPVQWNNSRFLDDYTENTAKTRDGTEFRLLFSVKKERGIPAPDGDFILKFSSDTFVALQSDRSWFVPRDEMDECSGEEKRPQNFGFSIRLGFESSCRATVFSLLQSLESEHICVCECIFLAVWI